MNSVNGAIVMNVQIQIDRLFKLLSDKNRLRIINLLLYKELCVCEIEDIIQTTQTNISHHLAKLTMAGILHQRKQGQWVYYKIDEDFIDRNTLLINYLKNAFGLDELFKNDIEKITNAITHESVVNKRCK
jgi:ArsR family transcriptional regulator